MLKLAVGTILDQEMTKSVRCGQNPEKKNSKIRQKEPRLGFMQYGENKNIERCPKVPTYNI